MIGLTTTRNETSRKEGLNTLNEENDSYMRITTSVSCLIVFGAMLIVASCEQPQKPIIASDSERRIGPLGIVTQIPIKINGCQTDAVVIAHAADPIVWVFIDKTYTISFNSRVDPVTKKPITPSNFYGTKNAFFWDPSGTPSDCNESVTTGHTTISGGCSIKYNITDGGACNNDPTVQIIPDGDVVISATIK